MKFPLSKAKPFLKSFCLILMAVILNTPTFAAIPKEGVLDFYNKNGIYYYNPAGNEDNCNTSATTLVGNDLTEKIWNFFIQNGFNDAQTAGILGNGMAESGNEPTRASNSNYFGLFQWGGGRKDKLFEKFRQAGLIKYTSTEYWPSGAYKNIPEADLSRYWRGYEEPPKEGYPA